MTLNEMCLCGSTIFNALTLIILILLIIKNS